MTPKSPAPAAAEAADSSRTFSNPLQASRPRLLVLGAGGQVGNSLLRLCQSADSPMHVLGLTRSQAPLDQPDLFGSAVAQAIESFKPSHILNAAAYTAVDQAEKEPELAHRVNGQALAQLSELAAKHSAQASQAIAILHYSTDYVFDGQKPVGQAYQPKDPTAPEGVYGKSKYAGEQALAQGPSPSLVLRTSWVFSDHGKNFVKTMLRLGQSQQELRVVADQWGAPTSADAIARASLAIVQQWPRPSEAPSNQVLHFCCEGTTSWHGFACDILDRSRRLAPELAWTITSAQQIKAISTAEFAAPAPRPANSQLDCSLTDKQFGLRRPHWSQALNDVLVKLLAKPLG
jgi:dTDP-4-dehydrorhamnose reductase